MRSQKGIIHLLPVLIVAAILIIAAVMLLKAKFIKPSSQEPTVTLKQEYKNPFSKTSQYVNPFDQFKSPFINFRGLKALGNNP